MNKPCSLEIRLRGLFFCGFFFILPESQETMRDIISRQFCLVLAIMLTTACDLINEPDQTKAQATVSLSLAGEVLADGMLMTEKGGSDLYGINIYYDDDNDGTIDAGYGYGLFDNPNLMKVTLDPGYKYKFVSTIVRDGKNKLNNTYGKTPGKYGAPFFQEMKNEFILGKGVMSGLSSGSVSIAGESYYRSMPPVDRFYGETTDYKPVEGDLVTIPLLRTSFGLKIILTDIPEDMIFQGGCLDIWGTTTTDSDSVYEYVHSFPDIYACWANNGKYGYIEDISVSAGLSKTGEIFKMVSYDKITLKRNVTAVVQIKCHPDKIADFTISEEPM